jgi:hypothetical protein
MEKQKMSRLFKLKTVRHWATPAGCYPAGLTQALLIIICSRVRFAESSPVQTTFRYRFITLSCGLRFTLDRLKTELQAKKSPN